MRTLLVTGSDTGIGKTRVVGALARLLAGRGHRVQVVKVVETGVEPGQPGDAARACEGAGANAVPITLATFLKPLAPASAAQDEGRELSLEGLLERLHALPPTDFRICEGAGGIASPIDSRGRDWADFAREAGVDQVVVVVPDRLGAINQGRLAALRAYEGGQPFGVWLNASSPVDPEVARSNRAGLRSAGIALWAEQRHGAEMPNDPESLWEIVGGGDSAQGLALESGSLSRRCRLALEERSAKKILRTLRTTIPQAGRLNLADNDYLDLARDPAIAAAARAVTEREGTSSSASPLVTGWRVDHEALVAALANWHGFSCGLLWSSGYAANSGVLGTLPKADDLVFADRLIHHSMIAGLQKSGARLKRYRHLDLDQLESWLGEGPAGGPGRMTWVVTESVFSMDGGYPDLARLARLKAQYSFAWVLDEAHALGWYGPGGAGLAQAAGVSAAVDILVGTLGKTLASGGAYTLFHDPLIRDTLVNLAGEFVYSTAIPPANAAAAGAALLRVRTLSADQALWRAASREFRTALRTDGWSAEDGDSPVVPVRLDDEEAAVSLASALESEGIRVAAIRPPTVPVGTSRLRISLKRTLTPGDYERVRSAMNRWRKAR